MDLEKLKVLVKESVNFIQPPKELTLFSIGGKGYYENPTTDLLAFFSDPNQVHGFGDLIIQSFFACLSIEFPDSTKLVLPPQREVVTRNNKRLDLLLIGDDWILAVENKIQHIQNNPFEDYEQHLKILHPNKKIFMVVLSPSGTSLNATWRPVSYATLISEIQNKIEIFFTKQKSTKWFVFLREFLIHLENEATENVMEDKQIEFVENNYIVINQIMELRDNYPKIIEKKAKSILDELFPNSIVTTKFYSEFSSGPGIRFFIDTWGEKNNIVIYLNSNPEEIGLRISMYAFGVQEDEMILSDTISKGLITWSEKPAWRCWRTVDGWSDHNLMLQKFRDLAKLFHGFLQEKSLI